MDKTQIKKQSKRSTKKTFKQGDENELERKLRLEKVFSSKQLRLAMEMEQKGRARLEKMVATPTAQVGPGNRGQNKSK